VKVSDELKSMTQNRQSLILGVPFHGDVSGQGRVPEGLVPFRALFEMVSELRGELLRSDLAGFPQQQFLQTFTGPPVQPGPMSWRLPPVQHFAVQCMHELVSR
jgi:hypothetical protein